MVLQIAGALLDEPAIARFDKSFAIFADIDFDPHAASFGTNTNMMS